jgi:hypothetical protein
MGKRYFIVTILAAFGSSAFAQVYEIATFNTDVAAAVEAGQDSGSSQPPGQSSSEVATQQNPLQDARDRVYYPGDTERVKPLARKLVGNVLLDQKDIWTSPFHMHKSDAKWWLGIGAVTAALIATDRHTSTLLENSKGQVAWGNHLSTIGAAYTLIPIVAGFYTFGVFDENPKARETAVLGGEALLDSLIVVSILKPIAGRNRPNAKDDQGSFFDGGSSFPSGHAIETWSLASVISYEYGHTKLVPIIACALAGVVTVSRFGAQQHYASDLVAGAGMGWFIGRYVWKTHQDHAIHPHSKVHAQIVPQIQPGSRTYAMSVVLSK